MKKLASLIVALALLMTLCAMAEPEGYSQAPMFDELVESGALPPLEERLPDTPKVADDRSAEYL